MLISRRRLGYQPALDGIRAFAVVAVIASHSTLWHHPGGWIGVDVFFVLSGFLITSLLLEEWTASHGIGLLAFYARRFLRLIPPFLAFTAITGTAFYAWGAPSERHAVVAALPWVLTYLANWGEVRNIPFGPFGHLWSLAVEEQFYILWAPISLLALRSRYRERALLGAAAAGVLACTIARLYPLAFGGVARGGYGTDIQCDGIFLGCALAVMWHQGWLRLSGRSNRWIGFAGVLILVDLVRHATVPGGVFAGEVLALSIALATVGIIAAVVTEPDGPLARFLSAPPLVWIGRRSYAMYLWHFAITSALAVRGVSTRDRFALGLTGSVLLAHLSMLVIEGPLQGVRARFSYSGAARLVDGGVGDASDGSVVDHLEHVEVHEAMAPPLSHVGDDGPRLHPVAVGHRTEKLGVALDMDPRPQSDVGGEHVVGEAQQPPGMGQPLVPEQRQGFADVVEVLGGSIG